MTPEPPAEPAALDRPTPGSNVRLFAFFSAVILFTGAATLLMADFLWRTGWTPSRTLLLAIFAVLFGYLSFGCCHAVFGFFATRGAGDPQRLARRRDTRRIDLTNPGFSVAIVMPVFNEDAARVFDGIRAIYQSLQKTGCLEMFDLFILSDTNEPDKWVAEEGEWFDLCRDLGALGRIFYRRREVNEGKKAGNISSFCRAWGKRYRYMVVLDADSIMRGETIVELVRLMEANPRAGLIQSVPTLVNAESLFGRLQQFANRLYGPTFLAGLEFWHGPGGNYWGHNAIIRVQPFIDHCDLPQLPGKKPFGGQILSHDFVEAALMRAAGWDVWLARDLHGSYEEGPQELIESAKRDRRWCQGNLQHGMLLFARGLRSTSRIHLANGILGYLASPLWLMFLIVSTIILFNHHQSGLTLIAVAAFNDLLDLSLVQHGMVIFALTMTALFLPKALCLADLIARPERARGFGGRIRAAASVGLETAFSALIAPILMLFHTKFVVTILLGRGVHWAAQKRGAADGTAWSVAARTHASHTAVGLAWAGFALWLDPLFFAWLSPVLAGLVFSIPISVWTSRTRAAAALQRAGLLAIPEEIDPPKEIVDVHESAAARKRRASAKARGFNGAVLDPYLNALHVSLLRERKLDEDRVPEPSGSDDAQLRETVLREGGAALSLDDRMRLLLDDHAMIWLHREVWLRSRADLHPSWRDAIRAYSWEGAAPHPAP